MRLVAALFAWSLLAWGAALALMTEAELERADAIVVLGGSASYRERARHAASLYAAGRAPLILLTDDRQRGGWSQSEGRNPFFVERARDELTGAGVPAASVVVLPGAVASTRDEAALVAEQARARGLRAVLIVTSVYHSRRALWIARRALDESGVKVGLSAAPRGERTPHPALWWLSADGWRSVAAEYPKLVYYRFAY